MVEFGSATENIRSFRANLGDLAALTIDETLRLAYDDVKAKILLVLSISNGVEVIKAHSRIETIKDLVGKGIGFEDTALGRIRLNS